MYIKTSDGRKGERDRVRGWRREKELAIKEASEAKVSRGSVPLACQGWSSL